MAKQENKRHKSPDSAREDAAWTPVEGWENIALAGKIQTPPPDDTAAVCLAAVMAQNADPALLATIYKDILRAMPDRFAVYDLNGCLIFSNWKEDVLLRPRNPTDRQPQCWACFFRGDRECMHCQVSEVLRTGKLQAKEVYNPVQRRFWAVSHFPVRDASGEITMIAELVEDVTRTRRTEQALRVAKNEAETADRAKSEFLATMSHEIRTPMNGVLGMLDLAMSTELDEEQTEYLEAAQASAESLLGLINDILDFSKIEAGMVDLDLQPFELSHRISLLRTMFVPRAREKGLTIHMDLTPDVPDLLLGDPLRLRQILVNLLGNAIKFTERGEVSLTVRKFDETPEKVVLEFAIKDSGVGMTAEQIKIIFDRFKQADSSTARRHQGTGLGLAISRSLAQLMNGDITVESAPGQGSVFYFRAPFTKVSAQPAQKSDAAAAATGTHSAAKLLVAEDHPINAMFIERLLRKNGFTVHCVQNGEEVLKAVAKERYDLILMDIAMPVLDGVETTKRLRAETRMRTPREVPIIAMTAHAMKGDKEKFLDQGMDDYIGKPIQSRLLLRLLDQYLSAGENPDGNKT